MEFYSTNQRTHQVSLRKAVLSGMPQDGGLYMPGRIPELSGSFFRSLGNRTLQEIAAEVSRHFLSAEIPEPVQENIIRDAINFDAPVVSLGDHLYSLELFHGPTLAFKDFGARFMARLMAYFVRNEDRELTILVATSGDTGSAVAQGFYQVPGITVYVLYPEGKVSLIQEKQFTTLGENIVALEIGGNFDDCQRLVKQAFLDGDLRENRWMTSANSINIARLLPQSFYYFHGYGQLPASDFPVVISVPSGNYGNLTAGLFARHMGLPVHRFLAAANTNDVVPEYLETGEFHPRPSVQTISNAMDVGNPSNFERIRALYDDNITSIRKDLAGYSYSDKRTRAAIREVRDRYGYTLDPHGAVGFLALRDYRKDLENPVQGLFLETAHPAKFSDVVEEEVETSVPIPERLRVTLDREKKAQSLSAEFDALKAFLLED